MKISVVVPLFDKEPYLRRCLDSVVAQTFGDFEAIIVDDGSSDGGGDLARRRGDSRFRCVRQENAGQSSARNRGLQEARCDWVAFLDADDEWSPQFLEAVHSAIARYRDVVSVFTNVLDAKSQRPLLQTTGEGLVDDYFEFLLNNGGLGMTSMGTLARRDALLSCGGFRDGVSVGEDHDAFCRLAWGGAIAYLPSLLAVYYPDIPHSSSSKARGERPEFPATVTSYRAYRDSGRIPERLVSSSRRVAQEILFDHAATLLNHGFRAEARRVLTQECEPRARRGWRPVSLRLRLLLPAAIHAALRRRLGRPARG